MWLRSTENGKPLAEKKVALLHHLHGLKGVDRGWKEVDLSRVPADPHEEEYGEGFARNVQKAYPAAPKELFRKVTDESLLSHLHERPRHSPVRVVLPDND